jgi:hypothetical protein
MVVKWPSAWPARSERATIRMRILLAVAVLVGTGVYLWHASPYWILGLGRDALTYWLAAGSPDPYGSDVVGTPLAYLYSPAFSQALAAAATLPFSVFLSLWWSLQVLVLAVLGWRAAERWPRWWIPVVALGLLEVWSGNVHLLLAGAVVLGLRWPAAWAFVLLTKLTPGIGLAWFAFRRDWRALLQALAATAAIVVVSVAIDPWGWFDWGVLLVSNINPGVPWGTIPLPFIVRLPVALGLLWWGAHRDQRWVVPIACMLTVPVVWPGALAFVVAAVALDAPLPTSETIRSAFGARRLRARLRELRAAGWPGPTAR